MGSLWPSPAARSCRPGLAASAPSRTMDTAQHSTESPRKPGLEAPFPHRFRSLFMKQQVMVARTLAPVTRATPVPTSRGTNRVSRACV